MSVVPVAPRRDPGATRRRWVERFDRFRHANQTVAQFCAAEGISEPSFYAWKRTLAAETTPTVAAPSPRPVPPTVVPIHLTPAPATPIELVLPSGTVVRFPADIRPDVVVAILRGLEERPC